MGQSFLNMSCAHGKTKGINIEPIIAKYKFNDEWSAYIPNGIKMRFKTKNIIATIKLIFKLFMLNNSCVEFRSF